VKKRQRRLVDVDEIVLSLYAKGLTTGEISAHFAEIYGVGIKGEDLADHRRRHRREARLGRASAGKQGVYVAVFIDTIMVKVRDGQVANRPVYAIARPGGGPFRRPRQRPVHAKPAPTRPAGAGHG
jgi:transposase-like protein